MKKDMPDLSWMKEIYVQPVIPSNAVTTRMFSDAHDISMKGADNILKSKVKDGVLQTMKARHPDGGQPINWYWPK